ncbi:MAG: tetratricopeptide repeat protein [Balneolales bacterium]|nr:tetratricopeptide repeat protein [Balneolales bacterium]
MNKETLLPYLLDSRELNKKQEKALDKLFKEIASKSNKERDAEDWFILGAVEQRNEHHEEALDAFTFAIEANGTFEAAWKFRATTHGLLNDWEQAANDIEKAIELDPSYTDAYVERAAIFRHSGNWEKALADLDKAVELDPEHEEALMLKAKTHYDSGNYGLAAEVYSMVLDENTANVEALASRGLSLFFEGKSEEALADIRKARTLEGGSTVSEFNMGLVMSALPEHSKQAYRHFEKAFKKDRKVLVRYVEMSEEFESSRLLGRLDEILKNLDERKEENFYTRELFDLLSRRLSEAKDAAVAKKASAS